MPFLIPLLLRTGVPLKFAGMAAKAVIVLGILAALGTTYAVGHWRGDDAGAARVQAEWDKDKTERALAYAKLQDEVRAKEQALNAKIAAARQERDHEKQVRAAVERQLADVVRKRPKRPAVSGGTPPDATFQAGGFGTGAQLYAEDLQFLAGEAARADNIRGALIECYAWHDAVMEAWSP